MTGVRKLWLATGALLLLLAGAWVLFDRLLPKGGFPPASMACPSCSGTVLEVRYGMSSMAGSEVRTLRTLPWGWTFTECAAPRGRWLSGG